MFFLSYDVLFANANPSNDTKIRENYLSALVAPSFLSCQFCVVD